MKKKFIFGVFIMFLLGSITGKYIYKNYNYSKEVFNEDNNLYFLQQGVYTNKDVLEESTKKINPKTIIKEDNKYYVYVGITKSNSIKNKLLSLYKKQGINVYLKKINIKDNSFVDNIKQFDILINKASDTEIIKVEEVVLSSYEEYLQNS